MLSRGLISGHWTRERESGAGFDFRTSTSPRFQGEALDHNLTLVDTLREVADGVGVVPLVGARRRDRLDEALGALDVTLDGATLERLETAFPPGVAAGDRYAASQMGQLDSER